MSDATSRGTAVVTGASAGIGAATAQRLATEGFTVIAVARREERLRALAERAAAAGTPLTTLACDITLDADLARLRDAVDAASSPLTVLVNNAGGARGAEPVEQSDVADWRWMYEANVIGTLRVTQTLLPALSASGAASIIVISSTAGLVTYEGGGGYAAAKHAETALTQTLRLELCGRPIRVVEIDPGMVRTEEFALLRFGGDSLRAASVYAGVAEPLLAEDVADCVAWAATRPQHVNIDRIVVRPLAQAAQHKVHRTT